MKTSTPGCNAHPKPAFLALGTPANNKKGVSNVSYVRQKLRAFLKSTQLPKIYAPYALQMSHLLIDIRRKIVGIRYIVSKQLVFSINYKR